MDRPAVLVGLRRQAAATAGQHAHLDAAAHHALGQLAHVAVEAASITGGYSHEMSRTRIAGRARYRVPAGRVRITCRD